MLGRRMVGALLVLGGMTLFLWGGVAWLIEKTDPTYGGIEAAAPADTNLALPFGAVLTLAGGIALLLSSARPVS